MHHATQALQLNFSFRFRGLVFVLIFCYLNTRPGHKCRSVRSKQTVWSRVIFAQDGALKYRIMGGL